MLQFVSKDVILRAALGLALSAPLVAPRLALAAQDDFLRVANFAQLSELTPAAREQYISEIRKMVIELAKKDVGTNHEFFGGTDLNMTALNAPAWQSGYVALLNAMEDPAHAKGSVSSDRMAARQVAAPDVPVQENNGKDGPRTKSDCQDGESLEDGFCILHVKSPQECDEKGTWISKGRMLVDNSTSDEVKNKVYCVPKREFGTYDLGGDMSGLDPNYYFIVTDPDRIKSYFVQGPHITAGRIHDMHKVCKGGKVDCSTNPKSDSPEYKKALKDFYAGQHDCINAGNVSEIAQRGSHSGHCGGLHSKKFGHYNVSCAKKGEILCNPLLFDVEKFGSDPSKTVGRCVTPSKDATFQCGKKFDEAQSEFDASRNSPNADARDIKKHFWDIAPVQEEMNKLAKVMNRTCAGASKVVQCTECQTMQAHLAKADAELKDCGTSEPAAGAPAATDKGSQDHKTQR